VETDQSGEVAFLMNKALWTVAAILLVQIQPLKASGVDLSPISSINLHGIEELPALLEQFQEGYAGIRTTRSKEEEELMLGTTPVLKPVFLQAKGYLRGVVEQEIA